MKSMKERIRNSIKHIDSMKTSHFFITVLLFCTIGGVAIALLTADKGDEQAPPAENTNQQHFIESIAEGELNGILDDGGTVTVYFYDPLCSACQATTPIIYPISEEMGIDLLPYDITTNEFATFHIEATPTIVHYQEGVEVDRVRGNIGHNGFREFFEKHYPEKE